MIAKKSVILDANVVYDWSGLKSAGKESTSVDMFIANLNGFYPCVTPMTVHEILLNAELADVLKFFRSKEVSVLPLPGTGLDNAFSIATNMLFSASSDEKAKKYMAEMSAASQDYIRKSFGIFLRILCLFSTFSVVEGFSATAEKSVLSANTAMMTKMVRELIGPFGNDLADAYCQPDNEKRSSYIKDSVGNLMKSHCHMLEQFRLATMANERLDTFLSSDRALRFAEDEIKTKWITKSVKKHRKLIAHTLLESQKDSRARFPYKYKIQLAESYFVQGRLIEVNDIPDSWLLAYLPDSAILSADNRLVRFLKNEDPQSFALCEKYRKNV